MNNSSIEKNLVLGLKNDNHNSFKSLFQLYSKPLFKFSVSYLKSKEAAEDVVQEVFTTVWNKRKELKINTSFKSYLFTIALNSIRKQFNKLSGLNEAKHEILLDFSENKSGFDDEDDYQILLEKLDKLIGSMPEKRRQVFIRKKLEEKSLKDIAQELNITTKTVEYHITESMKFLKTEFEKMQVKGLIFFSLFIAQDCFCESV
ncbi:RNA polymerase sigma-70 factor [uncultured Draconibacterium sp.]|uniref:RNA polymerase sigma factor n=1 Tax=uncultured Draconibacterium sp. TaxID=1573823 RepID=UPI0029C84A1D|nr:RNA polymerase sigma-70 factor [uncultured Draconibacterium sp.]